MRLVLSGREYPIEDALQKATLDDLYRLKVDMGVGMPMLIAAFDAMGAASDPAAVLDNADVLGALTAIVWLCRRRAGEKLTVAEAGDVPLAELRLVLDDEEDGEAVPTSAPTGSGRGAGEPTRVASKPKTSKKRSTAASS